STTSPDGSSSSTAATVSRGRATTRRGSSRRASGSTPWVAQQPPRPPTREPELEWVRMSPRARHAKGKARLAAYEELLAKDQQRDKTPESIEIYIPPGPRLGEVGGG